MGGNLCLARASYPSAVVYSLALTGTRRGAHGGGKARSREPHDV